jgi:RNA processing factor Prp31
VKAQTAPSDKRSIAASVALKAAVDTLAHTFTAESTAKNITNKVEPLANAYLMALLAMAADPPPEDYTKDGEDLPF